MTTKADILPRLASAGFAVIPDAIARSDMAQLAAAYDAAIANAKPEDVHVGRTTTRVNDFVNRGREFDAVYTCEELLLGCNAVIGNDFKLSSMHARTLRAGAAAQDLHVDVKRHTDGWPLVGFILMVDPFTEDNGATRFVPGSHLWPDPEHDVTSHTDEVTAIGTAGSIIVFNGSTWHGHGTNTTTGPRRSVQGAFVDRSTKHSYDFRSRMDSVTQARLGDITTRLL